MFKTLMAIINNINEIKYLQNRGGLRFKMLGDQSYESKNVDADDIERKIEEIERLQTDVRHENLRVFASNFAIAKGKQTAVYTIPAILIAVNIALWVLPNSRLATDKLDAYQVVETVLTEEKQIEDYTDGNTYYSVYMNRDFVNDTDKNLTTSTMDYLLFQIRDDLDGFLARLKIDNNGKLSVDSVDSGKYIDLSSYDFTNASAVEEKYLSLFDEVIELLHDSSYLNGEEKEQLLAIAANDKRDILVRIINYEYLGNLDVEVVKNNWGWRVGLLVVAALYLSILGYLRYDNGQPFEANRIYNVNGELKSEYLEEVGLFFLGVKYKAEFLKAEQDRINRLYDLYRETLHIESHPEDILTTYEKKLINREK